MFYWLKHRLKRWLGIEPEYISLVFDAMVDGVVQKVVAQKAIGLHLMCDIPQRLGTRRQLIAQGQACDGKHFHRLWCQLSYGSLDLTWSDGTKYRTIDQQPETNTSGETA